MKKFLLALAFLATNATAVEVVSSGCGDSYKEAIESAKYYAVERVNGVWIHGDSYVRDNLFSEKITQYSGGVVKNYELLKDHGTCVIIKADVVPRSNKVETNAINVDRGTVIHLKSKVDNNNKLQNAISAVDSKEKAITFKAEKTEFIPISDKEAAMRIKGELYFQDKWKADYTDLQKMSGGFDLPSFKSDPQFVLIGYDGGKEIYRTAFIYEGSLDLYDVTQTGVVVRLNKREDVTVKFRVPMNLMEHIDRFEVKVL